MRLRLSNGHMGVSSPSPLHLSRHWSNVILHNFPITKVMSSGIKIRILVHIGPGYGATIVEKHLDFHEAN
ncbi:hypothetical protein NPIL_407951, partial [Nephila pilipes]